MKLMLLVAALVLLATPATAQTAPAYVPVVLDEGKMTALLNALDGISMPAKARNEIMQVLREFAQAAAAAEKARTEKKD